VLIYGLAAAMWILLVLFGVDLILFEDTIRTYTVAVDKYKDTLEIMENSRVIYSSDHQLQEIQSIKTVISPEIASGATSSLVFVLKNNKEEVIDTAYQYTHSLPFYIDIHANTQAKMGKKIAEFLNVPYQDSEYRSIV
jgi:hypothetical protein